MKQLTDAKVNKVAEQGSDSRVVCPECGSSLRTSTLDNKLMVFCSYCPFHQAVNKTAESYALESAQEDLEPQAKKEPSEDFRNRVKQHKAMQLRKGRV